MARTPVIPAHVTTKACVSRTGPHEAGAIDTSKLATCAKATTNRQQSPLLRLPGELRNRIYAMILKSDCILIDWRYLTAFDAKAALRSACSSKSPKRSHGQIWQSDKPCILFPIVCRQIYEETHALLYTLNTFSFTTDTVMSSWISGRSLAQRQQVRSIKVPSNKSDYYRKTDASQLASIFPNLQTIYIDLWDIVRRDGLHYATKKKVKAMVEAETKRAAQWEGQTVRFICTSYRYVFGMEHGTELYAL